MRDIQTHARAPPVTAGRWVQHVVCRNPAEVGTLPETQTCQSIRDGALPGVSRDRIMLLPTFNLSQNRPVVMLDFVARSGCAKQPFAIVRGRYRFSPKWAGVRA